MGQLGPVDLVNRPHSPPPSPIRLLQEEDPAAFMRSAVGVSQMASMLHDTRRNDAYFRAIRAAVAAFRKQHGRPPLVGGLPRARRRALTRTHARMYTTAPLWVSPAGTPDWLCVCWDSAGCVYVGSAGVGCSLMWTAVPCAGVGHRCGHWAAGAFPAATSPPPPPHTPSFGPTSIAVAALHALVPLHPPPTQSPTAPGSRLPTPLPAPHSSFGQSMMACQAGAGHVYAFEMFSAMASIAQRVTQDCTGAPGATNDFGEPRCGITVFPVRSTDATAMGSGGGGGGSGGGGGGGDGGGGAGGGAGAGADGDHDPDSAPSLPRCDILVTEIFDSVLLGEGVIPTLAHAWEHLLAPGAVVVPRSGV